MEKTKAMCSFGTDEYGLQTGTMKISELNDFKGHPFKVEQDIQLFELMRSIEDKGVLVPLIVRSNPYGDGFACKRIADILVMVMRSSQGIEEKLPVLGRGLKKCL